MKKILEFAAMVLMLTFVLPRVVIGQDIQTEKKVRFQACQVLFYSDQEVQAMSCFKQYAQDYPDQLDQAQAKLREAMAFLVNHSSATEGNPFPTILDSATQDSFIWLLDEASRAAEEDRAHDAKGEDVESDILIEAQAFALRGIFDVHNMGARNVWDDFRGVFRITEADYQSDVLFTRGVVDYYLATDAMGGWMGLFESVAHNHGNGHGFNHIRDSLKNHRGPFADDKLFVMWAILSNAKGRHHDQCKADQILWYLSAKYPKNIYLQAQVQIEKIGPPKQCSLPGPLPYEE